MTTIDPKRLESMIGGIEELERWLLDILREGIAMLEQAPGDYWEELAGHMVDARLGVLARRIRSWPGLLTQRNGAQRLAEEIAEVYLLIQAFQRIDRLSPLQQIDVLTTGGLTHKKDQVKAGKPVRDHWLVAGQYFGEEENLRYRRTWLLGEKTGKTALLLDFTWGRQDFSEHWATGSAFTGEIVYYPSNYPQRALVLAFEWLNKPYEIPVGFEEFRSMLLHYSKASAAHPWLFSFPCLLQNCRPLFQEERWLLADQNRQIISLAESAKGHWDLLALSAGIPLSLFGQWENEQFLPLSTWRNGQLIPLTK